MAFYDHFHTSEASSITALGRKLVAMKNQHFIELIKRYCPDDSRTVLEIGCGRGYFAEQCRENGMSYSGIEANDKMAEALSARDFDVHHQFVPPLSLATKVDVIFMDQLFEHMNGRDQAVEMLNSCKSHLRHSGILVISSPDIFMWKEDFYGDYTHNLPTCMPMLERMFLDCDLEIIHRDYLAPCIRGLFLTRLLALLVRFCYGMGLFHVLFGRRAHLGKVSLLPSCVIIGRSIR